MVTVAVRRVDLAHEKEERNLLDVIDRDRYTILPNTAGCFTIEDTLRTARLTRELGLGDLIKLEHDGNHTFTRLTDGGDRREPWMFEVDESGTTTRIKRHGSYVNRIE